MNIYLNESAYLHYLVSEIERANFWGTTTGLTYFPTLFKESVLGYDAKFDKIGRPLFIQTKIPEHLTKSDSKEWEYFKKSYYRFSLYPNNKSHQHNLLVDLGIKFRNSVFYVAPIFHDDQTFSKYVINSKIIENSKFINTTRLPQIIGNDKHVICYSKGTKSKMWSDEITVEYSFDGESFYSNFSNIESINYQSFIAKIKTSIDDYLKPNQNHDYNPLLALFQIGILPVFIITK